MYTDEYKSYDRLEAEGYNHSRIHHAQKVYVSGDVHTNTIEGFWSLLRRGIGGTYHSVSTTYLQSYLDEYTFRERHRRYLAFLGRISPEKGVAAAIRIARRAGMPIRIGARMPLPHTEDPNTRRDWAYYEDEVQPLLEGPAVELIGQVGGKQKDDFLGNAAALLFPISWPEPFGLVMPEALACGTPVLALRAGSVPEIITDGVTGFIRDTEDELVEAVARIREIDRARCRAEVERRYTARVMTDNYLNVYERLSAQQVAKEPASIA